MAVIGTAGDGYAKGMGFARSRYDRVFLAGSGLFLDGHWPFPQQIVDPPELSIDQRSALKVLGGNANG